MDEYAEYYHGVIAVNVEKKEDDHYLITSEDLPGFLLAGDTLNELVADIPNVVTKLFNLNHDKDVFVYPAVSALDFGKGAEVEIPKYWIVSEDDSDLIELAEERLNEENAFEVLIEDLKSL